MYGDLDQTHHNKFMLNFSLMDLGKALSLSLKTNFHISNCQIDSRLIQEGGLFFAIRGQKTDGHLHLSEVKARGAVAAIVSKEYAGPSFGLELLPVPSVEDSLRFLARKDLEKTPLVQVVGVTGSVGKTTTKDFIATLLEGKYRVAKTQNSQNSKLTLPLTILNRRGNEEVLVLEMGMSEPGDMKRLVEIAPPDIAVLTKVAYVHAENFPGGIEQIAKGKGEIFQNAKTKYAIFEDSYLPFSESLLATQSYFSLENSQADFFASMFNGKCEIYEKGKVSRGFPFPFPQRHFLHNFLAAVNVARLLKVDWENIEAQTLKLQLPKMRFEKIEKQGILFINDAYNANPESVKAALSSLALVTAQGKRIAVLGTMKELGNLSSSLHAEVGRFAQNFVDHLFVLGEEAVDLCTTFAASKKPVEHFLDYASLASRLKEVAAQGDIVLIKGSRSLAMERILEEI